MNLAACYPLWVGRWPHGKPIGKEGIPQGFLCQQLLFTGTLALNMEVLLRVILAQNLQFENLSLKIPRTFCMQNECSAGAEALSWLTPLCQAASQGTGVKSIFKNTAVGEAIMTRSPL